MNRVIDAAVHLGRIICIADPAEAAERDRAFEAGTAEPLPPFPHLTAELVAHGAPMAGLLSPHGTVRWRGRQGRWDDVVGFDFCVVLRDADPAGALRSDQLRAPEGLDAHVVGVSAAPQGDLVVDADGKYLSFLTAHGAAGMVMRPDFYVFGGAAEAGGLVGLVDELLATLAENGIGARPQIEHAAA